MVNGKRKAQLLQQLLNAQLSFQDFQFALASHLRHPRRVPRPVGISARRTAIYRGLVRNNLEGFLLACFPITHRLLGVRRWPRLVDAFFREARCHTPYFREIPREFLHWLLTSPSLPVTFPAWLPELAHYEWVELALATAEDPPAAALLADPNGDLIGRPPQVSPLCWTLAYDWPVHRIGPDFIPTAPPGQQTFLVVYRNRQDEVKFMEINAVTARTSASFSNACIVAYSGAMLAS